MRIGHIDLSRHIAAAEEQLVVLVETLTTHDQRCRTINGAGRNFIAY